MEKIQKNISNLSISTKINSTNSINSIVNFLDNNQDVARIIFKDFLSYKPLYNNKKNLIDLSTYEFTMVFEEDKEQILQTYHTCVTLLTLKKLLEKAIRKDLKKNAYEIYITFVKKKFNRKSSFYRNLRKKIEKTIEDEYNKQNIDYYLIESLRWCHFLLIEISNIYYYKDKDIFWMTQYIEWQNCFESCNIGYY
tara:strand:+ start:581 stop:1165 length:585 start_codon:yes stop_codon:yes gene_type:complete